MCGCMDAYVDVDVDVDVDDYGKKGTRNGFPTGGNVTYA